MQQLLTDHLHAVYRAILAAVEQSVSGEILACDLVQVDRREFRFQSVAAAHFPNGPVRRLLLGCEERLAEHFAEMLPTPDGETSPITAGLAAFCRCVQSNLAASGMPWAGDQDFLVHDRDQFRVHCDGVRNFLFRVAVAEGRLDLVIDMAPRNLNCDWLDDAINRGGRTQVGTGEESIQQTAVVRRIMGHLAESGADVEVKLPCEGDVFELLQATFLANAFDPEGEKLVLTCARRTSLESAEDVPEQVTLVFILQDKLLQCSCPVLGHEHLWLDDDVALPTLELAYPAEVTYGQRRGAFRLEPPERVLGTVQRENRGDGVASLTAKEVPMRVMDISFTGAKLHLSSGAIISGFKGGTGVVCKIQLPESFGSVALRAIVRRLHINQDEAGRRGASLGVEFDEPDDSQGLAAVRRYIQDRHTSRLSTGSAELEIG